MRLQVSIKRYALPTTNIIFTTRALGPSPATSSPDATIAQLLDDVNDIVPLESADWGLEDYVVEVNGYECLHFSPIDAVLRDDDQVVIRALKTQDLRCRRLGGRHQISSQGRHLIDGVAFGRQWLKKGDRPSVQIPARSKRFKIEATADDSEEAATQRLALSGTGHADEFAYRDSDQEEDSDFVNEDVDALTDDDDDDDDDDESDSETGPSFAINVEPNLQIVARQDFEDADDVAKDSRGGSDSDQDISVEEASAQLSAELEALREEEYWYSSQVSGELPNSVTRPLPTDSGKIKTHGRKRKLRADHYSPNSDEIEFTGFSSPLAKRTKTAKVPTSHDSESDSTTTSSSSSSGSDSDEGSELDVSLAPSKKQQSLDGSADSDSSSESSDGGSSEDSESDSDAGSEDESSGSSPSSAQTSDVSNAVEEPRSTTLQPGHAIVSPEKTSLASASAGRSRRSPVPPGQGLKRTRYTNQRQKKRHRLKVLKEQGLLPDTATFADMAAYDEARQTANLAPAAAVAKVVEAKKQELLGQVKEQLGQQLDEQVREQTTDEVEHNPDTAAEPPTVSMYRTDSDLRLTEASRIRASSEQRREQCTPLHGIHAKDLIGPRLTSAMETTSEPPKPRARLDLNSTRNMIFNGLGVRKPKTVAAEEALRERLARPVKGALPKQLFKDAATKKDEGDCTISTESPTPWQDKLVVSAMECELDGVTLKPPPFPFIQGWDEDANRRLRNNKKKGRNQRQYYAYDEDTFMDGYDEHEEAPDEDDSLLDEEAQRDDRPQKPLTKAGNLMDEACKQLSTTASNPPAEDADELPHPDNMDSLPALQLQDALPGTVMAYKEFHLNAANFQPEISPYRIALVAAAHGDGSLDLRLAKWDRKPPQVARYDEETGKRILSRSEMWEGSDDDDEEDDGSRQLSYSDLIEPKLVQASNTSKPTANASIKGDDEHPNGPFSAETDSAVIPESMVPNSFTCTSAQQPASAATAAEAETETETDANMDIATPRRKEISTIIKEAGFHSTLGSELGVPMTDLTEKAEYSSPSLNVAKSSQSHSGKVSGESASGGHNSAVETSGFESPCFNGWSSSPPLEPEPDEVTEGAGFEEPAKSGQSNDAHQPEAVGDKPLTPVNDVAYPHISQLELDGSMQESSLAKIRGGSDNGSPAGFPTQTNVGRATHLDDSYAEGMEEEEHLDPSKSHVPPSADQAEGAGEAPASNKNALGTFIGTEDGQTSSDADELPSLAQITATAQSRHSRPSPPPAPPSIPSGKRKAGRLRGSTSPFAGSTASGSQQPPAKPSQSQVRLSHIPSGSLVVDLTCSSNPVSPYHSDGDYSKTQGLSQTSNKVQAGSGGGVVDKNDAVAASVGLGKRRLLKSKKTKP